MTFIETLNSLSWPAVFAIVGSLVTITVGLYGYLIGVKKIKHQNGGKPPPNGDLQTIHNRVSDLKDRTAKVEGDVKLLFDKWDTLAKQIDDHDSRDIEDFKKLETKLDKLTEIIMKMLSDDKL